MWCEDCQMEIDKSHTKEECDRIRAKFYQKTWNPYAVVATEGQPAEFDYTEFFKKSQSSDTLAQKLNVMLHEIEKLTQEYRLERNSEKCFLKLMEEIGEYSVAKLGDKKVTESPRQEMIDIIIVSLSLYFLEGGNLSHFCDYGIQKIQKWRSFNEK